MAKGAAATGRLDGARIVVDDATQANRIHAKGNVGELSGTALHLRIVEAAWLASEGRLSVAGPQGALLAGDLLAPALSGSERAEVEFLAYRDLRGRGLLVRAWKSGWAVWPRGAPATAEPEYAVEVRAERDAVQATQALAWAEAGTVLALVDEDGAVTYYRAGFDQPEGTCPLGDLPRIRGQILSDRVLVADAKADELRRLEHLGVPTGAGLVLSFTEAESLRRRGVLDVPADLAARAARLQPHFHRTLPVYEALRKAGVVAKSGFKFGTHLRGYRGDPDASHAEWLVQCVLPGETLHWADLSRAIRVAHGVRKRLLLAVSDH